jgi:two-component system, chemotaxis family, CheB/CheR fusion protein
MTKKNKLTLESTGPELVVIGVGASAGGLEALGEFLLGLPHNLPPLAIIIAQHVSPVHAIHLVEILSRSTQLKVLEARDGLVLEPDCVYITPPDREIAITQSHLRLWPSDLQIHPKPSIDTLFQSLAENLQKRAIGVILSGTGSDGALGIAAIKAFGGATLVQDPVLAAYEGMPQAAIQTGHVDFVLPANQLGLAIDSLLKGPEFLANFQAQQALVKPAVSDPINQILLLLSQRVGTDFSNYKLATLRRRIDKRLEELQIPNLETYLALLEQKPEELDNLFQTVLIGVTSFFRDSEAFENLKHYLSDLIKHKKQNEPIRLWVPGCATGEEAYSIAILLLELLRQIQGSYSIQIFATDIDDQAIGFARKGLYSCDALSDMPADLLQRYFLKRNGQYEVLRSVRSLILFSHHDLTENPPFLKLDLISCRNLLIYFDTNLQKHVLPLFHYALNPDGYLFLGRSDSVGAYSELFAVLENKSKIFQRKHVSTRVHLNFASFQPMNTRGNSSPTSPSLLNKGEICIADMVRATLFEGFSDPYVVVNSDFNLLEIRGDLKPFLNWREGSLNVNLPKLVNESLQIELHSALIQAQSERHQVKTAFRLHKSGEAEEYVRLVVKPLLNSPRDQIYLMVIFEIKLESEMTILSSQVENALDSPRIRELEKELAATKEHLQIYIEELETGNEELQSLNEELQSTNEEMQSSNEELETTNEELQSTNEEIQMAYGELKILYETLERKEIELRQAESHNQALLNNRLQGLLLVNRQYQILAQNAMAQHLLEQLGQAPILTSDVLLDFLPAPTSGLVLNDLQKVFSSRNRVGQFNGLQQEYRLEQMGQPPSWFLFQYMPVCDQNGEIDAVSIGFLETTHLRQLRSALHLQEQLLASVFDLIPTGIAVTDQDGRFVRVNQTYCQIYGYTAKELLGQHFSLVVQPEDRPAASLAYADFMSTGKNLPSEGQDIHKSGGLISVSVSAARLRQEDGSLLKITSVTDISEQKKYRNLLEETQKATHVAGWATDLITGQNTWIAEAYTILGVLPEEDLKLQNCSSYFVSEDSARFDLALALAIEHGTPFDLELQMDLSQGPPKWLRLTCNPIRVKHRTVFLYGTLLDISERKLNEEALNISRHKLLAAAELTQIGYWDFKLKTQELVPDSQLLKLLGQEPPAWQGSVAEFAECFLAPDNRVGFLAFFSQLPAATVSSQVFCMQNSKVALRYWRWSLQSVMQGSTIFGTVADETELQLQALALEEAISQLQIQNRDLLEFSHIVSHNLTGPLANLKGLTDLLRSQPDELETTELWQGIEKSIATLGMTIDELREILLIKDTHNAAFEQIDLAQMVQSILVDFEEKQKQTGTEISCDFSEVKKMTAIPVYLRSICFNLIENAFKYRSKMPLKIQIQSRIISSDQVCLQVQDNGRGINLKLYADRIFRLYQRFHPDIPGRGLGLFMSRLQAEAMGGRLAFQSEVNQGTCFELILPVQPSHQKSVSS